MTVSRGPPLPRAVLPWPLKLGDGLEMAFEIEGYPRPIAGREGLARVITTPEATTSVYLHSVFTAHQVMFTPLDAVPQHTVTVAVAEGPDVYRRIEQVPAGAANTGRRVLRSRAESSALNARVDGLAGQRYILHLRTPRRIGALPPGVRTIDSDSGDPAGGLSFDGPPGRHVRRDVRISWE